MPLAHGERRVRLNDIAHLERYASSAYGRKSDVLRIRFEYLTSLRGHTTICYIKSRDDDGVLAETETAIRDYLAKCAEAAVQDLLTRQREPASQ